MRASRKTKCEACQIKRESFLLRQRLVKFESDLEAAAGELLINIPEPGTDMARMMVANRLLKYEIERLNNIIKQNE